MILFETSISVFELLWDIALALFILKISFVYSTLSFLSGLFIAYIRITRLEPIHHLTQPQAELYTLPFFFLTNTLWARFIITHYEIPRVAGFRLAIGFVALLFMVTAELLGGVVLYEEGIREWIWETDTTAAGIGGVVLALFGVMPWLLMGLEKRGRRETYHGHEEKSIVDAVPTIGKTEKVQANGKKNL